MKHKHNVIGYIVFIIIVLILVALYFIFPDLKNVLDPENIRSYLLGLGGWAYIVYVLIIIASIPLPAPSTPLILAGGYVFGFIGGTLLALIAAVLAGTLMFFLTRKFGRPLVEKLVDPHHLAHFDHIFKKRGELAAFISFAIPLFPSDIINIMLGLTKIKYSTLIFIIIVGHIPRYLIINSLGADLYAGITLKTALMFGAAIIFVLIAAFREKLKKFFFKELKTLEKLAK